MVKTWTESDLMNCLKCPSFWQTDVDETECDKCGCGATDDLHPAPCECDD